MTAQKELKSYTGTYVMYISEGNIVITGREKFKNFKALFPVGEVREFVGSAKSDAVLEVGIDYIIQKLGQEYDDGGYNPDIPLWVQVKSDLKKLRTKDRDSQ